jgi:hypothetical protein
MNLTTTKQQDETWNSDSEPYEFPQRFNLLDMLGLSFSLWSQNSRPGEFDPTEEERYRKQPSDRTLIQK